MTQLAKLRAAFDAGESLTVAEALQRFGIYALSQRCGELERAGYPLDKETVETQGGAHVTRYSKLRIAYG